MKRFSIYALGSLLVIGLIAAFSPPNPSLEIGAKAPHSDRKMKDVSSKEFSLMDLKKENGILVVFSCNTCPFVVGTGTKDGWEGRYNGLFDLAETNGFGMVLVNSNEAFRGDEDSFEAMVSHAKKEGYRSKYVVDKDHVLADAFGARTTPHVFLFDKDLKLIYKGAIDDNNASAENVEAHYLKEALKNAAKGNSIDPNSTKALGCSIKRVKS